MTDTKVIRICGGLGNQMFQYAFGVALKNQGNAVLYDTGWFGEKRSKKTTPRKLELTHFMGKLPVASASKIRHVSGIYWGRIKIPKFIRPFFSRIYKEETEKNYVCHTDFMNVKGDAFFAGTFAHASYFDTYRKEILKDFTLKTPLTQPNKEMLKKIKSCPAVSIHIRRGDYVKLGWVCGLDFYYNAMAQIKKQIKNPHFFIFSDDISWVRENLKITDTHTFVDINDGDTGYFDMELMKNCQHNIIANSTFSWWAAYLNENPDKIVIEPKADYTPQVKITNPKVAILYIATKRYVTFWEDFYRSCEKYFLPNAQKTYFLFTDAKQIEALENVKKIPHKFLGWPQETLFRFQTFLTQKKELEKFDYIYFINGTMAPRRLIGNEIFPSQEQGLMVTLHPGGYRQKREKYTYDNNPASTAYIAPNQGKHYFMGGFNGGTSSAFLHLMQQLDKATQSDYEKGIVALWHDESHLNKYMLDKNPLILSPIYAYPERCKKGPMMEFSGSYKMIIKDKRDVQYGGHDYMRGTSDVKKEAPLVSVLMLVYNTKEEYLKEAIESVLEQTYSNFELIVLDDGSSVSPKDIVDSYHDSRICFYENDGNKGLVYSRNKLLKLAKGKYIALLDSDDIALPDRLSIQVNYLEKNSKIGVVGTWFEYFPEYFLLKFPQTHLKIVWNMLIKKQNVIGNSTALFRRELIDKFNLSYKTGFDVVEDYEFWLNLLNKTKFYIIPQSLVQYRCHQNNISNQNKQRNKKLLNRAVWLHRFWYFFGK